ncbi:Ivy family c-type lysozyme inhibitor [Paludibacterium purpuratum]|uniref:Inhibitor of lysozyme (Ivy) n=1 Tax=Paludibacterium purpuratum TaxID=1144873 RepID=A0A4R7AZE1_9NEIS|nr:Ivy family c-type lysozyme inhibitor [Paludibacterium purpuratum]TDR73805.1 inhibitor of lysozyme (Ivy) [Paludibacterium purpuratum]
MKKILLTLFAGLTVCQVMASPLASADCRHYQAFFYQLAEQGYTDDSGQVAYDAQFDRAFTHLVAPLVSKDRRFRDKITSGPSTSGEVFADGQGVYVRHELCQAHQCADYKMITLYDVRSKRMVGLLLDHGKQRPLGSPSGDVLPLLTASQANSRLALCVSKAP